MSLINRSNRVKIRQKLFHGDQIRFPIKIDWPNLVLIATYGRFWNYDFIKEQEILTSEKICDEYFCGDEKYTNIYRKSGKLTYTIPDGKLKSHIYEFDKWYVTSHCVNKGCCSCGDVYCSICDQSDYVFGDETLIFIVSSSDLPTYPMKFGRFDNVQTLFGK